MSMIYAFLNQPGGIGRVRINSTTGELFAHACCVALGASVLGLCLVRTTKHFDSPYVTGMVLSGGFLIVVLFWTRSVARRLATRETAKKPATQFLWSCVCFGMLSFSLGMAVSGFVWFGTDFMRRFNLVFWTALTGVAIYPVLRDAKRLADAAGPSQITSAPGDHGNQ